MKNNTKDKGISRIDSGSTHGWFVRGYKNGKTYSKLFSDGLLCGKDAALYVARMYRDELHAGLAKIESRPRGRRIAYRDARNTTGVLGVCKTRKKGPNGTISRIGLLG